MNLNSIDFLINGKQVAQETLNKLRNIVMNYKQHDPSINEETMFLELSDQWIKGFKNEFIKIVGIDNATKILNIYGKTNRS